MAVRRNAVIVKQWGAMELCIGQLIDPPLSRVLLLLYHEANLYSKRESYCPELYSLQCA